MQVAAVQLHLEEEKAKAVRREELHAAARSEFETIKAHLQSDKVCPKIAKDSCTQNKYYLGQIASRTASNVGESLSRTTPTAVWPSSGSFGKSNR